MAKPGPMSQIGLLNRQINQNYNLGLNPVAWRRPDKTQYELIWTEYDMQQCCARLKWKGLPPGITSWNLNRMLYFRGSVIGFKRNDRIYILPYISEGDFNVYGMPLKVKPLAFNGEYLGDSKKAVMAFGEDTDEYELYAMESEINPEDLEKYAVTLYDGIPFQLQSKSISRYYLNNVIIKEIAESLARVNINMAISNKKIIFSVKDAKQRDVVNEELTTMFGSEAPFCVITAPLDPQTIQSTNDFNCDDIFNTVKNWDAIRCFMSGIDSGHFGIDKKERVATGELVGSSEQTGFIQEITLELAQNWANTMNELFGTEISVELRARDFGEYENGNGNDNEEEAFEDSEDKEV